MTDTSSVTKLFIPPSDRRLRRTTTSKMPSERALNRHKIPGPTNYARQPFSSNTGLRFSRKMAVATIRPFQMLGSLCVIDTNFTILRHFLLKSWSNEMLRKFIRTLYCLFEGILTQGILLKNCIQQFLTGFLSCTLVSTKRSVCHR
jgi:hypothetical protein